MKILTLIFSTALLVVLASEAVILHRKTVCRQDAWRATATLHTRTLLTRPALSEAEPLLSCRIIASRTKARVSWKRIGPSPLHIVSLNLRGKL